MVRQERSSHSQIGAKKDKKPTPLKLEELKVGDVVFVEVDSPEDKENPLEYNTSAIILKIRYFEKEKRKERLSWVYLEDEFGHDTSSTITKRIEATEISSKICDNFYRTQREALLAGLCRSKRYFEKEKKKLEEIESKIGE